MYICVLSCAPAVAGRESPNNYSGEYCEVFIRWALASPSTEAVFRNNLYAILVFGLPHLHSEHVQPTLPFIED